MAPCLLRFLLLLLTAVGADAAALNVQDQAQVPLVTAVDEADNVQGEGHSGLHGRFLHITGAFELVQRLSRCVRRGIDADIVCIQISMQTCSTKPTRR